MSSIALTEPASGRTDEAPSGNPPSLTSLQELLETVHGRQEEHGRILRFIAECVAPREDSSKINDLIGLLIGKIDAQSAMIRTIAGQLHRQGRTLPGDVAQALDERHAAGRRATEMEPGANGQGRSTP